MAEVRTRTVTYPGGSGQAGGYLAQPDDGRDHPGLIVLQEWWGIDAHIEDMTRRLAREGFVALAPDLYHGRVTDDPEEARGLSRSLDVEAATADILAAIDHLRASGGVAPRRVGVIGFCMGGSYTLEVAARSPDVAAAAAFYGSRTAEFVDRADRISAPLFAAFGAEDASIPQDVVQNFRAALSRAGQPATVEVYPGAGHAFMNDQRLSYRPAAAADAWRRALQLFRDQLR